VCAFFYSINRALSRVDTLALTRVRFKQNCIVPHQNIVSLLLAGISRSGKGPEPHLQSAKRTFLVVRLANTSIIGYRILDLVNGRHIRLKMNPTAPSSLLNLGVSVRIFGLYGTPVPYASNHRAKQRATKNNLKCQREEKNRAEKVDKKIKRPKASLHLLMPRSQLRIK
jgi:hypothetical protein